MAETTQLVKRRRTTSKTGCLTCKARKVKCDEGRPACERCLSTGRVCDGYGIWGGGGNGYADRQAQRSSSASPTKTQLALQVRVPTFGCSRDEQGYFEWFQLKTAKKMPGVFVDAFWQALVPQATAAEPAIFHAALTLSTVSRSSISDEPISWHARCTDKQEGFLLRNYSKAIQNLQRHFVDKSLASVRIALIACVIFTTLEFLRGNFRTGQSHLRNGLCILQDFYGIAYDDVVVLKTVDDPTDQHIIDTFQRLNVLVELFHSTHRHSVLLLQSSTPLTPASFFYTPTDAWTSLERLLNKTIALTSMATPLPSQHAANPPTPPYLNIALTTLRQRIQTSLAHWLAQYKASNTLLTQHDPSGFVSALLANYHTLASILCATALSSEQAYDAQTPRFLSILSSCIWLWKKHVPVRAQGTPKLGSRMRYHVTYSTASFGWAPLLYFTAVKCRVRRVRLHAVRLLESTVHREGIWDCCLASRVMRRVVEVEDEAVAGGAMWEAFALGEVPVFGELAGPAVPLERRVAEMKILLEDDMRERVAVEYKRAGEGARWERMWVSLLDRNPLITG